MDPGVLELPVRDLEQPGRHLGLRGRRRRPRSGSDALEELIPSYTSTTLQLGFTHDNGWETSLVVRNLFDERGVNYMSSSDYSSGPDDMLPWTDDRYKHVRSLQRPRTIGLSFSKKW